MISATTRAPSSEVREALGLKRGARVHEIIRVRSADGAPVLLEETYLPAGLFPGLLSADLTGSVYALMADEFGVTLWSADEHIEAAPATAARAELLGVTEGDPLLLVTHRPRQRRCPGRVLPRLLPGRSHPHPGEVVGRP